MSAGAYHDIRLPFDEGRARLWRILVAHELQPLLPPRARVLDLGCGHGYFIRAVQAAERHALDREPSVQDRLGPGVRFHAADARQSIPLPDASVDAVFASNFLEHLEPGDVEGVLTSVRRVLVPGGVLLLLQPNFRYCAARYFDDYTHRSVWTHVSLPDRLRASGFRIDRVKPRCLPLEAPRSPGPLLQAAARLYLLSPWRPFAAQMLVAGRREGS